MYEGWDRSEKISARRSRSLFEVYVGEVCNQESSLHASISESNIATPLWGFGRLSIFQVAGDEQGRCPHGTIAARERSMEGHFDFVNDWAEWRRDDFAYFERVHGLGARLWGYGRIENLTRQLELPSPEIPQGAGKEELLALEKHARMMLLSANHRWASKYLTHVVTVGDNEFTVAEAMYEIVRRAIASLR
jgi:hypothetical protein